MPKCYFNKFAAYFQNNWRATSGKHCGNLVIPKVQNKSVVSVVYYLANFLN